MLSPSRTACTLTPPTIRPLGAEEYAEALVAEPALGALSLDLTFNVASSALSAYAADGAVYPRPDGLVERWLPGVPPEEVCLLRRAPF